MDASNDDGLRERMLEHLAKVKAQATEMMESSDDDELFKPTDPIDESSHVPDVDESPSNGTKIGDQANIVLTEQPKKKKKKNKKSKTADLPEAGSAIPDDYVEKFNEDPEDDPFNPSRPLAQRVEYAMAKYRKNHKFSISKKNIFDDYLRFGGINTGQNAFQGRTTGADNPGDELAEDDFEAAKAGIDAIDDDMDEDTSVSFAEVAQIYFGSRFIRQSKFIQMSEFHEATEVVDSFLRYLQIRNVCPEYADDIDAARAICDKARVELPKCKSLTNMFPDKFNQACCVLFEGDQKDIMDFVPTWSIGDSNLQATYGNFLADTIGMTKTEALSIVSPIVGAIDERKVVERKPVQKVQILRIDSLAADASSAAVDVTADTVPVNSQHAVSGVYVTITVSNYESRSEQYTILLEKNVSDQVIPNMVFTADFYKLDNGQWYIDRVCSIFPSFYMEEEETSDEEV